jgi:hypothetical protein
MTVLPRISAEDVEDERPGTWTLCKSSVGTMWAVVCCPRCSGHIGYELPEPLPDAYFNASLDCRCGYSGDVRLDGLSQEAVEQALRRPH